MKKLASLLTDLCPPLGKTIPFSGNSGWKNKLRASKNFFGDIILYLLNIFATAAQNKSKKFQKLNFNLNYCTLPQFAGCFTTFNFGSSHPQQNYDCAPDQWLKLRSQTPSKDSKMEPTFENLLKCLHLGRNQCLTILLSKGGLWI